MLAGGLLAGWRLSATAERRAAARALALERRRVAADVHDLIMQDLSLALANARTLANGYASGSRANASRANASRANVVVSAGERALAGARTVLGGLARTPEAEPIVQEIEASAQLAARSTPLIFDAAGVPRSARADEPTRAALLHVAREAVTNAAKHGAPNTIEVTLRYGPFGGGWHLTVRDEGEGFDASATNNGFGLASMRAHAHALGGALHVTSGAERGTTVEVVLP